MSTSLFFSSETHQHRLCSGLFGGQMDGFAAWLHAQGYSRGIGQDKLCNIHAFECWLTERQIDFATLDEALYESFQN